MRFEKHHILFHRAQHEATQANRWMRNDALGMIAMLTPDTHHALHSVCPAVPVLDIDTAMRVKRNYVPNMHPLVAIENYAEAVEEAIGSLRTHPIEKQLGLLVVEAIYLQRCFIAEDYRV